VAAEDLFHRCDQRRRLSGNDRASAGISLCDGIAPSLHAAIGPQRRIEENPDSRRIKIAFALHPVEHSFVPTSVRRHLELA
jgi:hypothetical protein